MHTSFPPNSTTTTQLLISTQLHSQELPPVLILDQVLHYFLTCPSTPLYCHLDLFLSRVCYPFFVHTSLCFCIHYCLFHSDLLHLFPKQFYSSTYLLTGSKLKLLVSTNIFHPLTQLNTSYKENSFLFLHHPHI